MTTTKPRRINLITGDETYVFIYDSESRSELLRVVRRYASDPHRSFTWYDAAIVSQHIRKEVLL